MHPDSSPDGLLTVDETASLLRIHPNTVRKLGKVGQLPMIRPTGRMVRFRRSDVQAFIERRSVR